MAAGHAANRAGDFERARQCFEQAGTLTLPVTLTLTVSLTVTVTVTLP